MLFSFGTAGVVNGQGVDWARQFGTDQSDAGTGVSPDGMGGVYLSGFQNEDTGIVGVGFLRRYDSAGNVLWTREFGGDSKLTDVSADALGGVYLSGFDASGFFVKKYDAAGSSLWTMPVPSFDNSLSSDGLGNVYVTGSAVGDPMAVPQELDTVLTKFDSAGAQLWTRKFGSNETEQGLDVSADSLGNVFVSGSTRGAGLSTSADSFLTKFDAAGNQFWTRTFAGVSPTYGPSHDVAFGVAADGTGNVAVTGTMSTFILAFESQSFLQKYDEDGNLLWQRIAPTSVYDTGNDVATDAVGNVYITGQSGPPLGSLSLPSAYITKYDAAGDFAWKQGYGSPYIDRGLAIAAGPGGTLFLTGETFGSLVTFGGASAGEEDVFLLQIQTIPEPSTGIVAALCIVAWSFCRMPRVRPAAW
jgi:hypothetical protein